MTKQNLKYYLKNKLSKKELKFVPSSFDVVGDILIFSDFPKELVKKEKIIGNTILKNYHHIKTILKKTKKYSGKFRTPKLKVIAGEKIKICLTIKTVRPELVEGQVIFSVRQIRGESIF